jgi:hypothetical protein
MTTRSVKLFHLRSGRFLPAHTIDIASGGILVQIDWPSNVFSGDRVDIYLPEHDHAILRERERHPATVVRVLRGESLCLVAAKFAQDLTAAAPATLTKRAAA